MSADERAYPTRPFLGASAAIFRGEAVLLAQRGKPPYRGVWSLPGGLVETGEHLAEAARREVAEETGIVAEIGPLVDFHEILVRDGAGAVERHFVVAVFAGRWLSGEPVAGDDAIGARFLPLSDIASADLTEGTAMLIERAHASL